MQPITTPNSRLHSKRTRLLQLGPQLNTVRRSNVSDLTVGGGYTGNKFTDFLRSQGTKRRLTTHDTPQHNGVAESLNRRLLEQVRAVLHHSQLPKNLWGEALHFIVWLKNRLTTRALGKITSHEQLYRSKPDLGRVPEWGQRIWVHQDRGSKLDGRAAEA